VPGRRNQQGQQQAVVFFHANKKAVA
jgi:hypothetical protein